MNSKGTCKLCLRRRTLRKSHLIPAGVYRECSEPSLPNPNPTISTSRALFQSSKQLWNHVLCSDCERRLDKSGEDYSLRQMAHRDGRFPLLDQLTTTPPDSVTGDLALYFGSRRPEIKIAKLGYFAMSVFWRAAAHNWDQDIRQLGLGPAEEEIRKFLMSEDEYPTSTTLFAKLSPRPALMASYTPVQVSSGAVNDYRFYIPGIEFELWVGRPMPSRLRRYCTYSSPHHPIFVTFEVTRNAGEMLKRHMTTGRLTRGLLETMEQIRRIRSRSSPQG